MAESMRRAGRDISQSMKQKLHMIDQMIQDFNNEEKEKIIEDLGESVNRLLMPVCSCDTDCMVVVSV